MKSLTLSILALQIAFSAISQNDNNVMDISGRWGFSFESRHVTDSVSLPGTLDTNLIGTPNTNYDETSQLSRKVTYTGPAYYYKTITIPEEWKGKFITLTLERTRPSTLWIDGKEIGSVDYISAPHVYDLTGNLSPGEHEIKIMVDNGKRLPDEIKVSSHEATESTQTNWNGIVGKMYLQARSPLHISEVQPYPDAKNKTVRLLVKLSTDKGLNGKNLSVKHNGRTIGHSALKTGVGEYEVSANLGDDAATWSEWNPKRHSLDIMINGIDTVTEKIGLRDFSRKDHHFFVNDTLTFLRGTHDGAVFPLTAYAPMDVESWRKYFKTIKEYGLNHVRFHSWCPPEACFEAADMEGIYLQPELPIWGGFDDKNKPLMEYLMAEGEEIHRLYSRHPSFVLFSLGNELWGEVPVMESFVNRYRSEDPRHLYTFGTNAFCGWKGYLPGQDFLVTCKVGGGDGYSTHVRASFAYVDAEEGGIINNTYPDTKRNFEHAVQLCPEPVIGHETGQYQVYPNYNQIEKYTGVLEPRNLEVFRRRLMDANMQGQAQDFFRSSGLWSAELYKADMEMNLRTSSMAGFQLLDIKDYPGQGTALVGMLDSFMESKGLITPERWRESCDEIVVLAEFPSYTWTESDTLKSKIALANYSGHDLTGEAISVALRSDGATIADFTFDIPSGQGYLEVDSIAVPLAEDSKPQKLFLDLHLPSQNVKNSYPLWVYPKNVDMDIPSDIILSRQLGEEETNHLRKGGTIILAPKKEDVENTTVGGLFITDYWNYRMFKSICENNNKPVSPGTLGIHTNPNHAIFSQFPTESHTNWQWYPIVKNSYPLIIDSLNSIDYRPLVQVIDNVERNHRLGLVMEFAVERGKMIVVMANTDEIKKYPEGRQFLKSIMEYAASNEFNPSTHLTSEQVKNILATPAAKVGISTIRNVSYD